MYPVPPFVPWVVLGALFALTVALGIILVFHWFAYARNSMASVIATVVYFLGAFILFGLLLGAFAALP